ncbi:MAG: hypothetical protein ABIX46_10775 [Burkholderiaceae bacterium]
MKYARRWLAWVSGMVLYGVVIVASRFVAGSSVPSDFAGHFAASGSVDAAIVEAVLVGFFVFVLSVGWGYATLRPYNKGRRVFTLWCLAGLACGFGVVFLLSLVDAKEEGRSMAPSVLLSLLSSHQPPLWGLLNVVATPLGLWLAGALVRRAVPPVSRRRSTLRPR